MQPASMSSAPPRALCHSAGAGYTLCLFVIPSDSADARGQTCNPERSLHKQALRTQKTHKLRLRFCLSLFLPTLTSLSSPLSPSLSSYITVLHCCKMTLSSTFFCPAASFQITSHCFCLSTTQCHIVHSDAPNQTRLTQHCIFGNAKS